MSRLKSLWTEIHFQLLLLILIFINVGVTQNGFSKPSDEDYEQCLLRMLHCYILPKITLHQDDLGKVINAREKQALNIQSLDRKVIEECKTIDACELQMEDLRTQFLPDLEKFISKGWCSKGFLNLLLEDVSKEEPKLRQQVHDYILCNWTGNFLYLQNVPSPVSCMYMVPAVAFNYEFFTV